MSERLRLADLLSGLSVVSDLGYGLPIETALRSCLIGTAVARRMALSEREVADVFYVSLLSHVGCVAYAQETFELFGDDQAVRRATVETDLTDVRDIFATLIPRSTRGLHPAARLKGAVRMAVTGRAFGKAHDQARCEVARSVSRRIGLPDSVSKSLYDIHEWWNGAGARSLHGEQISRPARIARVATEASELLSLGARDVANALRHRAGKTLDPAVVEHLISAFAAVLTDATSGDPRARILDIEPSPVVQIGEADLPRIARAFGELADLKSPYMHGHSSEVTALSVATADRLRLDRQTSACLEVAAYLHDLGRIGVSNRIWAKPGTLTTGEWEQVHLHPYHSERILASTAALKPMARIAGMHHERIDGSGYHRGCRGRDIDVAARVLACADAFQAMTQRRPHRAALEPEQARDALLGEARAGRLDSEVVAAVLDASHLTPVRRHHLRPGGLSDRKLEVLRLVSEGCSNPEIGRRLGISRRTAEHHVQHIYDKIGVSTRAAAVLFARARPADPPLNSREPWPRWVGRSTDARVLVWVRRFLGAVGGRVMRVEESAIIRRPAEDVFTFLENRANDTAWMASVMNSEWLESAGKPCLGRRGRMVISIRILGRRMTFLDEVTDYVPGRRIAHRTVEGPLPLNTACICEPAEHGCRTTVVGELDRIPGGWIGRLAAPFLGRIIRYGFNADLARLKALLEAQLEDAVTSADDDLPTTRDFGHFYDARKAASELRSYRNKGPIPSTKMLIDAFKTEDVEGATVIDIGGGIGAVQHELLAAGAAHVTSIDASDAYIQTAREESERRRLTGRVTYYHGDFLQLAETIPPADIVTLDRVINVFPDWKQLIRISAARARRLYGLVYPRDTLPVRMVVSVMNFLVWRGPVHAAVRPPDEIDRWSVRPASFGISRGHRDPGRSWSTAAVDAVNPSGDVLNFL